MLVKNVKRMVFLGLLVVFCGVTTAVHAEVIDAMVGKPTSPTETTVAYPQVGFGFYMTEPTVTINQLGYYDDGDDGLLADHTVALYQHVGGAVPYSLIAKATIPAGTDATLSNGYRWVDIPEMEISDTRGPGDYFILMSSGGTDVRHEPAAGGLSSNPTFGTLTGDSLWLGMPLSGLNVGDTISPNNAIGTGGYSGANMGYVAVVPEPSMLILLACGLIGFVCQAWRKQK